MRVAIKHQVDVWVEVDLKTKRVDRVVVDDEQLSSAKPIAYHVILPDGVYDTTRYAGKKMARAARKVKDEEQDWPTWSLGW